MRCVSMKPSWLLLLHFGDKMFSFSVSFILFLLRYGSWSLSTGLLQWKCRLDYLLCFKLKLCLSDDVMVLLPGDVKSSTRIVVGLLPT
uniref:Uncharacterized protein n=1 Tax=Arundo donax TaxID=35708 RepID=A0A0A8ZBM2_ARUDO